MVVDNKKKSKKDKSFLTAIIFGCVTIFIVIAILMFYIITSDDNKDHTDDMQSDNIVDIEQKEPDKLEVISVEEKNDVVVVTTSYCVFEYPYAFSDLIEVSAVNKNGMYALDFVAEINDKKINLYTIFFNGESGIPFGNLKLDGRNVSLSVEFAEIDEGLTNDDGRSTFYATQETFNDVAASLAKDDRFTSAD